MIDRASEYDTRQLEVQGFVVKEIIEYIQVLNVLIIKLK